MEIKQVKEDNVKLKEAVLEQNKRIEYLKREIRKENLIIKGVTDNEKKSVAETEGKIHKILEEIEINKNINEEVDKIRRIRKYRTGTNRLILAKLSREKTKVRILKKVKNSKGSDVWIDEDYPKNIQERKELGPILKEAKSKGCKAYLKYNKLIINNEMYNPNDKERTNQSEIETSKYIQKETATAKSPENNNFDEQIRKITRIHTSKN
ncbi:hypothetical protein ILUMI_00160 [Ignelater luminosus]|uniref:Endonuclease-reverse transcriptase n=1 Tax=Ignelater luminosus TaxID=2038154 RepID=A0A8K0GND3_IGNLU|nr:hypothetical protein ILUMI_00160 [Ignelater luminosus]